MFILCFYYDVNVCSWSVQFGWINRGRGNLIFTFIHKVLKFQNHHIWQWLYPKTGLTHTTYTCTHTLGSLSRYVHWVMRVERRETVSGDGGCFMGVGWWGVFRCYMLWRGWGDCQGCWLVGGLQLDRAQILKAYCPPTGLTDRRWTHSGR